MPEFKADPFGCLQRLGNVYGDIYRVPLPFYDVVVVNHPDHVGQVMNCREGEYSMIGPAGWITHVLGASIPMMEGARFRERRKLLMPMFSVRHLSKIADTVADEFAKRLAAWDRFAETGEQVDLQHLIAGLTMPAFMRAMFSIELTDNEIHQIDVDTRAMMRTVAAPFFLSPAPRLLPGGDNPVQAYRRMRKWVRQRVDERLADPVPHDDLLQVILDARYQDGTPISRRDAIMETIILIGGGYETVVASLSWTLGLLAQNSEAQQRLFGEVDQLDGVIPTYEDLGRLSWARACFDEGQRLQGHPFHPRFAMVDDTIGGYRIRRGNVIAVSIYALQRDPRWWSPEPDSYDPNRFYDKDVASARPNLAYMPFGAGPHRCIGSAMAYMNAQFLLAMIHQRFRIQTPPGWVPRHASTFSCTVQGGVPAVLTRASAAATI
ncbi:cytochrome P450 [Mycolicibacter kumamotonensis]|uniref:Cytochrome P450 n=1 Tax=Mycolicibacter kumamotonensis TaxID=354243 RepID=A0A1B8SI89_9MYCO|nr:cytochrome P450 [Mycolicibacter kumamotonensis]